MNYTFVPVGACNMCSSRERKILGRRMNTSQGLRPRTKIGISTTVVRCKDCGLTYADPLPIPADINDHYGIPPEEYWKEARLESPDHFLHQLEVIRRINPESTSLLDIGAGLGNTVRSAIERGWDAYGIEASSTFVERAKLGDRIIHSMVEDAKIDRTFDAISFGVVLEHLYDPAGAISKALTWLNPGGVIHIEVPDSNYLFSKIFNLYFRLVLTDYVVNISPMHSPFHLYEFTERSFQLNGERLGYRIVEVERYAGETTLTGKLDSLLSPLMKATKTGMGLVVYLQKA